ncbi:MAG: hypothetical protein ABJB40_07745 [Acidobacteriota bacterium]
MKLPKIAFVCFLLFAAQSIRAQTETLEGVQYRPPKGWARTEKQGAVTYTDVNMGTNAFCILTVDGKRTEKVAFSIQPGTHKFANGLGLAYRLEPEGKTFTNPPEISVHYNDHDLEGTFPEALSLAYQDDKGTWHMQTVPAIGGVANIHPTPLKAGEAGCEE